MQIYACSTIEMRMVFTKVYSGGEPSKHLQDIAYYLRLFQVSHVYADHGGGNFAISQLARMIPNIQIIPVMYSEQAAPYTWNAKAHRFTVSRTCMIDNFILDIKTKKITAYRWEDFQEFAKDYLALKEDIIGEDRGAGKRVWRRHPATPDDAFHAGLYGWLACRMLRGETNFTTSA
jgi:hypothetical protein